jgi:hypothetical protein
MADLGLPREQDSETLLVLPETVRRPLEGRDSLLFRSGAIAPLNWNACALPMNLVPKPYAAG